MSEVEIFARADQVLADVVGRIPAEALDEPLPADFPTHGDRPYTFREVLGYQAYDEAGIPDMVAGRTLDEVGQDAYGAPIDNGLLADAPSRRFEELVEDSIRAVRGLSESDLDTRTVHYSYGEVAQLRSILPPHVTVGVSGDAIAATGLNAGCEAWYSVIAGTLPAPALALTRAVQSGDAGRAREVSARLQPLWDLFARHGSFRVTAAIAEHLGLVSQPTLPLPIKGLDDDGRADVARVVAELDLAAEAGQW